MTKKRELKQRLAELAVENARLEAELAFYRNLHATRTITIPAQPYRPWPDDSAAQPVEPFGRYRVTCVGGN